MDIHDQQNNRASEKQRHQTVEKFICTLVGKIYGDWTSYVLYFQCAVRITFTNMLAKDLEFENDLDILKYSVFLEILFNIVK